MQAIYRFSLLLSILLIPAVLLGQQLPAHKPTPWYMKPVVRPAIPVGLSSSGNPIDAFVAAKLKDKGLQPVGPATKATLLRRVYLDLIGIPPTPAEQAGFLADNSPNA